MATYTSTSGNYKTTLTVTETATSIPNNTSTLSWSLKVERIGGASQYGIHNANQCPWSVSINGSRVGSGTFSYDFRYTGSYNLGSGNNVTVAHNNDGTKTGVAVSGTVDLDNSAYVSVMTASGTIDLTPIPRASDISLSVGSYNVTSSSGNAFTYTITAKSTSFYNRLRYTLGSTNYTGSGSTGSRSGNFTNAELLTSLPTATSGSLTAYVDTATDSGFTNIIGTNSVSIPISINTSYIKPSLTLQNLSVNSSPISGYAVAGYSKVQCGTSSSKWSASGGYGTNAITVTFTTSHGSLAQSSYSASSNSISNYTVTNILPSSSSNYTLTISATARDSRGATTSASKTYTVYGYTPPTANLTAYRVASSGSTAEDGAGTVAYVAFSGAVSSSVNSQNTLQSVSCSYSGSISGTIAGSTSATTSRWLSLTDTQTVTFTVTATDKVTSSTATKTISTASYPLDLYDNGSGSVGVGLGTVAQGDRIKFGLPLVSANNQIGIILSDVNNNDCKAIDSSLTSSSTDEAWFSALLKAICVKYPNKSGYLFKGLLSPNSMRWYEIYIYDTSVVQDGYPRYSFGNYYSYGNRDNTPRPFGTTDYTFYWHDGIIARYADGANTATSATTAGTAGTATNASFADYLNLVATNEIRFRNRLQNVGGIWFNYQWYEGSYATLNGYNFGNGAGGYTHLVASGYYDNSSNKAPLEKTLWTGTKMAGESAGISLNVSAYKRLRIFFNAYSNTGVFELDLEHATQVVDFSGWSYRAVGLTYAYATNPETHFCDVRVNDAKTNVYPQRMGYYRWNSSASSISSAMDTQLRNQNSNYYVYRIDGIL